VVVESNTVAIIEHGRYLLQAIINDDAWIFECSFGLERIATQLLA